MVFALAGDSTTIKLFAMNNYFRLSRTATASLLIASISSDGSATDPPADRETPLNPCANKAFSYPHKGIDFYSSSLL